MENYRIRKMLNKLRMSVEALHATIDDKLEEIDAIVDCLDDDDYDHIYDDEFGLYEYGDGGYEYYD